MTDAMTLTLVTDLTVRRPPTLGKDNATTPLMMTTVTPRSVTAAYVAAGATATATSMMTWIVVTMAAVMNTGARMT